MDNNDDNNDKTSQGWPLAGFYKAGGVRFSKKELNLDSWQILLCKRYFLLCKIMMKLMVKNRSSFIKLVVYKLVKSRIFLATKKLNWLVQMRSRTGAMWAKKLASGSVARRLLRQRRPHGESADGGRRTSTASAPIWGMASLVMKMTHDFTWRGAVGRRAAGQVRRAQPHAWQALRPPTRLPCACRLCTNLTLDGTLAPLPRRARRWWRQRKHGWWLQGDRPIAPTCDFARGGGHECEKRRRRQRGWWL